MPLASLFASITLLDVVGSAFILVGLLFVYPAFRYISDDLSSHTWPQAVGVLKSVEAFETIIEGTERNNYKRYVRHGCRLEYVYNVEGKEYAAPVIKTAEDRQDAERIASGEHLGSSIPLHYHPKKHAHHRFTNTPASNNILWLVPVFGFCGFGLLVLYVSQKFY
jgi:hypothetical protein